MPHFPGLSDADSCREWDPGIPIELDQIRDKDESYWDGYRGTPKAFITLAAARRLWSNRFGSLTAARYPDTKLSAEQLASELMSRLDPAGLGLSFMPVRQDGLRAGSSGTDLGGLFIGLSFFIIVAALLLTGLLFVLGVEQRATETGILRAVGYSPTIVRRLVLAEGAVLALIGAGLGAICGVAYNKIVLHFLSTVWQGAVGATVLEPDLRWRTLITGIAAGVIRALLAMWLAARRHAARPLPDLLGAVSNLRHRYLESRPRLSLVTPYFRNRIPPIAAELRGLAGATLRVQ